MVFHIYTAFSALTLLAGWQEGHPACKKTEWWGAGMVICLERSADLHTSQLMPLPLTVSCFSKIQISFTFLIPAHPGSPGQRAVKRVCVAYIQVTAEVHKFFKLQQLASLRPHHCPANRRTFQDLALRFPGLSTSWKFYKLGTAVNRASGLSQGCISQRLSR